MNYRPWLAPTAAAAVLLVAGCGAGDDAAPSPSPSPPAASTSTTPSESPASTDDDGVLEFDGTVENAAEHCDMLEWEHEACEDVDESLLDIAEAVCESSDGAAFVTVLTVSVAELDGGPATAGRLLDHAEDVCGDEFATQIEIMRKFDEW